MKNPDAIYFQSKGFPEFRFMSNFYVAPFVWNGLTIPTVEHLYQACKATNDEDREYVLTAPTPGEAARRGRRLKNLSETWDTWKVVVMKRCVTMKFEQNTDIKEALIATHPRELVEFAPWGDTFWGVDKNYEGQNNLGKILMSLRQRFIEERDKR